MELAFDAVVVLVRLTEALGADVVWKIGVQDKILLRQWRKSALTVRRFRNRCAATSPA